MILRYNWVENGREWVGQNWKIWVESFMDDPLNILWCKFSMVIIVSQELDSNKLDLPILMLDIGLYWTLLDFIG